MSISFNKTLKAGIAWSTINQIIIQIFSFGFGVILARLILPSEFGLLAMITVFSGFAGIFKDLGFGAALIQKNKTTNEDLSTSFWTNLVAGVILFIALYCSAGAIANFYDNPKIILLTRVVAINFVISSLFVVQNALVIKEVKFNLITKINSIAMVLSNLGGITIAFYGYGVWALVFSLLLRNMVLTVFFWTKVKWKPQFIFCKTSLISLFGFGGIATLNSIFTYLNRNTDNFIIGKLGGEHSLGLYNRAYSLMLLPVRNISNGFKSALFPSLAKIQDDREEIKRLYLKSTRLVALFAFPIMFGLSAVAEPFVLFLYGDNWAEMIPVLQVLCILGAFQSLMGFNGTIFYALGKPIYESKIYIIITPLLIAGFITGYYLAGLMGLIYLYSIIEILTIPFKLSYVNKLIPGSSLKVLKQTAPIILYSAIMWIIIYFVKVSFFTENISLVFALLISIAIGISIYCSMLYFLSNSLFQETWTLIKRTKK